MKYELVARRIGNVIIPPEVVVKEKGLGRFFVPKEDRRLYRLRVRQLAEEYGFARYNPFLEDGSQEFSIGR